MDPAQRRLGAVAGHLQPRSRAQPRPLAALHPAAATPPSAEAHETALGGLFGGADVSPPPGARVEQLSEHMGVRVRGIEDVRRLQPPNVRWLLTLLYRHRLLAVSGQHHLRLPEFSAFTQHFGRPEWEVFYKGTGRNRAPFVPDHPEVLCVTSLGPGSFSFDGARRPFLEYNLAKSAAQRDPSFVSNFQWHTDNSYEEEPAAATWLYVNRLPENGGKTSLTNMIAAYDALPAATQRRIDGLVAPHYTGPGILGDHMSEVYGDRWNSGPTGPHGKLSASQVAFLGSPRHLLARPHPVTGAKALYCPCATSRGIQGMDDAEALSLLRELTDHALSPRFRYDHTHEEGDLVAWDTAATMHKANTLPAAETEADVRILFRITVKGKPPLLDA